MGRALGLIEVMGLPGAIEAADAALKAANVTLLHVAKVGSGIMTVEITGDVGAVTAAVEAGALAASKVTTLRAKHVIPRMDDSLLETIVPMNPKNIVNASSKVEGKQNSIVPIEPNTQSQPIHDIQTNSSEELNKETEINNTDVFDDSTREDKNKSEGIAETLLKKSNSQLKNMVADLGISMSQDEIKRLKKQELVKLLERHLKESIEKGES